MKPVDARQQALHKGDGITEVTLVEDTIIEQWLTTLEVNGVRKEVQVLLAFERNQLNRLARGILPGEDLPKTKHALVLIVERSFEAYDDQGSTALQRRLVRPL